MDGAFDDLDRARSLNPVSLDPDLAEGRIAIAARRYDEAREAFEHSLTVEDNWLAHYELALVNTARALPRGRRELRTGPHPECARSGADPPETEHRRPAEGGFEGREHPDSEGCDSSLYNVRKVRYVGLGWEKSRPRGSHVHKRLLKLTLLAACVLALMVAGTASLRPRPGTPMVAWPESRRDRAVVTLLAEAAAAADTSGQLPFTGLELGVFAVIGAGLLGTGLVLRRTLRSDQV